MVSCHLNGLEKTKLMPGNTRTIEIVSDPAVFNRMTVWRKTSDSKFICIEPAYEQNGINSGGIKIAAWKAIFYGIVYLCCRMNEQEPF